MEKKILIVDDEPNMCKTLKLLFQEEGFNVEVSLSGEDAQKKFTDDIDVVVADLSMEGMDGISLLKWIKDRFPDTQVIIMTAYSTVQSAVEAMKSGAFDYIIKPFENDEMLYCIKNAFKIASLSKENRLLRQKLYGKRKLHDIIGKSKEMEEVFYLIERAAESDSTVLITGESGTGKEITARAIHFEGERKSYPFITINCAALPETLLESELFGHEKGAFTGAIKTKIGMFEKADKGTVFLDEIGNMSLTLQSKLLRVIENKYIQRVGSTDLIAVDIRIISATNKDLEKEVKNGNFREDLYYRLNVISIHLPPLREREGDLPLLIQHILMEKSKNLGKEGMKISDRAMNFLLNYNYPGNIREIENIIERAIVLARSDVISEEDLPQKIVKGRETFVDKKIPFGKEMKGSWQKLQDWTKEMEKELITRALKEFKDYSNEEIANMLGMTRRVFELRINEYNLIKPK